MSPSAYVLTVAAETDLREIIRYTHAHWGDAQVRRYVSKLEQGIARLAARQGRFAELSKLHPALIMSRCEHHYIFCLHRDEEPALIIAILHERMNAVARVANRLIEDA